MAATAVVGFLSFHLQALSPQSEAASAGSHDNCTPGKDQLGEKTDFTVRKNPGLEPQTGQAGTGTVLALGPGTGTIEV